LEFSKLIALKEPAGGESAACKPPSFRHVVPALEPVEELVGHRGGQGGPSVVREASTAARRSAASSGLYAGVVMSVMSAVGEIPRRSVHLRKRRF
jgi:hypothetical protein